MDFDSLLKERLEVNLALYSILLVLGKVIDKSIILSNWMSINRKLTKLQKR